jgi:hypothetical protein
MYLTDLSFIEEGTPNVTEESLVNFSKMRMVSSFLITRGHWGTCFVIDGAVRMIIPRLALL